MLARKFVILFIFLYLLCLGNLAIRPAQDAFGEELEKKGTVPLFRAEFDRGSARVGETVTLIITYQLPEGARLPENLKVQGLEGLSILKSAVHAGRFEFVLLVDQIEELKTGDLSLSYVDNQGEKKTLSAKPATLTVESNLGPKPEEAVLRPLQEIIPASPDWLRYLPWAAGFLLLAAAAVGLLVLRKKKRKRNKTETSDPPHVRARKEIERLESMGLFESGRYKEFYFSFSEILRKYLEALRGFPAAELTTLEITLAMDNERDKSLLPLLREMDLVKFADAVPSPIRKEEDIKKVLAYIQDTSPLENGFPEHRPLESNS